MANVEDAVKFTAYKGVKSSVGMEPVKVLRKLITHADLDAAATSDTVDFDEQLPDGAMIMGIARKLLEDFAGGSVSTCVIDLGDGSNVDRFIDNANIFTGAANTYVAETADTVGDGADTGGLPLALSAATTLRATITASHNVNTLTAGSIMLYVYYFFPQDPDA